MRIGFFLREAVRATRRSSASSFAALATVLVTMLMLGVFIPIVQATNGAANTVRSRVEVDVYFKASATKAAEARVVKVPLTKTHAHDVKAMIAAAPIMTRATTIKPMRSSTKRNPRSMGNLPMPEGIEFEPGLFRIIHR